VVSPLPDVLLRGSDAALTLHCVPRATRAIAPTQRARRPASHRPAGLASMPALPPRTTGGVAPHTGGTVGTLRTLWPDRATARRIMDPTARCGGLADGNRSEVAHHYALRVTSPRPSRVRRDCRPRIVAGCRRARCRRR
jgi:hypothetical protein